jgi:hypothetical protein
MEPPADVVLHDSTNPSNSGKEDANLSLPTAIGSMRSYDAAHISIDTSPGSLIPPRSPLALARDTDGLLLSPQPQNVCRQLDDGKKGNPSYDAPG